MKGKKLIKLLILGIIGLIISLIMAATMLYKEHQVTEMQEAIRFVDHCNIINVKKGPECDGISEVVGEIKSGITNNREDIHNLIMSSVILSSLSGAYLALILLMAFCINTIIPSLKTNSKLRHTKDMVKQAATYHELRQTGVISEEQLKHKLLELKGEL